MVELLMRTNKAAAGPLAADRAIITQFVDALFRHADEGGFISLRTFPHERGKPAVEIRAVQINGEGLAPVVAQATGAANRAARHPEPVVFCPPVCVLGNAKQARESDLLNGVALSIECDARPVEARTRLEGILSRATVVVASGGSWTDPATGEIEAKVHLHWRLAEPTRTPEGHARLKRARAIATALAGGDPSAVPLVHPLRWPGSWHRKGKPTLCQIAALQAEAEIDLDDALERLEGAAMLALEHADEEEANRLKVALGLRSGDRREPPAHDPEARDPDLEALAAAIPNRDEPRAEWISVGLAFYAASEGSAAGFNAWDRWSRKSVKAHGGVTAQWEHFAKSPPGRTGTGSLVKRAQRADPHFRLPSWGPKREEDQAPGAGASQSTGKGTDEWPKPDLSIVEARRTRAPSLPLELFGPFWSDWIAAAAEGKGSRADYVALPLLSTAGALLANVRRASPWSGWVEPPIIWTANVGNPSSGKSPALDAVTDLVRAIEAEMDGDYEDRRRSHIVATELAKAQRQEWERSVQEAVKRKTPPPEPCAEIEPPQPLSRRRLFSSDTTVEKLARLAAANERGFLLMRDELGGWLGGLDRYGGNGSDRSFFIEAYGGRAYVVDRVKDAEAVRVPFLSVAVMGGVQPDRLVSLLFQGDDDGLAARLLFVWPEPCRPTRPRRAADDEAALGALRWLLAVLQDDHDGRKVPRVVPFEPAAADTLQAWREQVADLEAEAAGLFLSWIGKLPGLAVRLALVFEFLWWAGQRSLSAPEPDTIGVRAVAAALAFLQKYAVPMARRTFGDAAAPLPDRDAAALAKWLVAQPELPTIVNARGLRRKPAISGCRAPERYDQALTELVEAGWLRPAPSRAADRGGRRSKDFEVNPALAGARP
jgi:hypothetical protein